jgi:hypothetical protein
MFYAWIAPQNALEKGKFVKDADNLRQIVTKLVKAR